LAGALFFSWLLMFAASVYALIVILGGAGSVHMRRSPGERGFFYGNISRSGYLR